MSTSATSSISSMLNSRTRITGYASGLDVDSLVTKLMKIETAKVDRVKQQKQYLEWQKSAYRDFTTSLTALKNKYFNVTSSSNLYSPTAFNKTAVSVSDTSILSVTGDSTAGTSTHTLTVNNIATVGAMAGSTVAANTSTTMDVFTGLTTADTVLTIGSTSYKFNAGETVNDFMTRVNNDTANTAYRISYDSTGSRFVLTTKSTGVNTVSASGAFLSKAGLMNTLPASGTSFGTTDPGAQSLATFVSGNVGDTVLTIGSTNYTIQAGDTVNSFLSRVNSDPNNTGYTLNLDNTTDPNNIRFTVTPKNGSVTMSGKFLVSAGLVTDPAKAYSMSVTASGVNASFSLDGISYASTTNTFSADGLTYNFLKAGTANVSSTRDVEGIIKNVEAFVTDYNKIIGDINTKVSEKKYSSYTPLTDDEKSAMKDADITLWETKAKSGLLQNDDLLLGVGDKLKEAMYSQYTLSDGTTKMCLSDIGIGTTSRYDQGVLTVDETKLRTALTSNPNNVIDLLTKESTTAYSADGNNSIRKSENGVFANLSDTLNDYVRTFRDSNGNKGLLLQKAGTLNDTTDTNNLMDTLINEKDTMINDLMDKLQSKQDYYYSKFTAMETAISNMNSQSSFLSSLSGSSSSK